MPSQVPASDDPDGPEPLDQWKGMGLVVTGACVFAMVAVIVNRDPLPLLFATECRYLVCWVAAACFITQHNCMAKRGRAQKLEWFGPSSRSRRQRPWLYWKSFMSFGFQVLWWAGLRTAPIGDSITLIYCSPVLTSVFSWLLLSERFPKFFLLQLLLVACGVILVVQPPFLVGHHIAPGGKPPDYTYTFLALSLCALIPVATAKTRGCHWVQVEHVCAFAAAFIANPILLCGEELLRGSTPALLGDRKLPATSEVLLIGLAAIGSFIGLGCETRGYQLADPGRASMVRYVEVPFAYVLQHLFCSDKEPVRSSAVLGSVLILGSCAVSLLEERKRSMTPVATPSTPGPKSEVQERLLNGH